MELSDIFKLSRNHPLNAGSFLCCTRLAPLFLFLAVSLGVYQSPAQSKDEYEAVDAYALSVPKSAATSADHLAAVLSKGAQTQREKARVIYRWITRNITYDTHAFFSGEFGDMSANSVLKTMKGVCDGYAQLFAALGTSMGLEVERITGNSKGYGYVLGSPIHGPANHAWNAVKIDGVWQLVDCTWGAGYIDAKKDFIEHFNDYYFLTPPSQFIYDHFPDDPQKQFLSPPISKDAYENLADVRPVFFIDGLNFVSDRSGIIRAQKRADIMIDAPRNVFLMLQLLHNGRTSDPYLTYISRNGETATLSALFPETGTYVLRLFVKEQESAERQYEKALDYQIGVEEALATPAAYPAMFEAFDAYGLKITSDVERERQVNRNVSVELSSGPGVLVTASLERNGTRLADNFTFVQSQDGTHDVRALFPQPGDYILTIYAKQKSESGDYNAVLKYPFVSVAAKDIDACFPFVYEQYRTCNARLLSPLDGHLETGHSYPLTIQVPEAEAVAVVNNGHWTNLSKEGKVFGGSITVDPGKAEVFAKFPGNKQFVGLLRYEGVR